MSSPEQLRFASRHSLFTLQQIAKSHWPYLISIVEISRVTFGMHEAMYGKTADPIQLSLSCSLVYRTHEQLDFVILISLQTY